MLSFKLWATDIKMAKFQKFADEIVGNNIEDFFSAEQISENRSGLHYLESGNERQNYQRKIWVDYINLNFEIERLNNVEVYFSIKHIPHHYKDGGISNLEYYNYHYEHFRIKSISIIDYLVLLINHCLQLGIPTRKCNVYSITENTILKSSDLIKSLKKFDDEFIQLRSDRNKIIHEGSIEPDSLVQLNSIIMTHETFNMNPDAEETLAESKIEMVNEAIKSFKKDIAMINKHVEIILNNLIPYIKKQVDIFKITE